MTRSKLVSSGRWPDGGGTIVAFPGSASPGLGNHRLDYDGPVLNEVLARNRRANLAPWGDFTGWVELYNPRLASVDLGGFALGRSRTSPDRWTVPLGTTIPAGGYLSVWCDASRPASAAGGVVVNTGFALDGASGEVVLFEPGGRPVDTVEYGFQVTDLPIGRDGGVWRLLGSPTPSAANARPAALGPANGLRINEWMADPLSGEDWFELFNPAALPVDLGGLFLSDSPSVTGRISTPILPLSFVGARQSVTWIADENPAGGRDHVRFRLDRLGETLRLYDRDLTLLDAVDYGLQGPGVSQGRLPDGSPRLVAFPGNPTPGAGNYLPLTNAVINEVLTHGDPPFEDAIELMVQPAADGVSITEAVQLEFLELRNISDEPVPLFDPEYPGNVWRLANAVTFPFPPHSSIPPGGCLLVVPFDPGSDAAAVAAFRAAYGGQGVLVGPYAGRLDDRGECVELYRPDRPRSVSQPDAGFVPYLLVERVVYGTAAPWPTNTMSQAQSLQRLLPTGYGNDPANWVAAVPTPGRPLGPDDLDGDGLPDEWERQHATDPGRPDGDADPDGDGMTNAAEYAAGTEPQSAASRLALEVLGVSADTVTLAASARLVLEAVPASATERTALVVDGAPARAARFYSLATP